MVTSNLLDDVLARTSYPSSNIVSVNNDLNSINVGEGSRFQAGKSGLPSDRIKSQIEAIENAGSWDANEYGRSRVEQVARLRVTLAKVLAFEASPEGIEKARVEAERELDSMRQLAIRRAGLDTTGGRINLMVAGQSPWHRLGTLVREAVTSDEAELLAGQNFTVGKVRPTYERDGKIFQSSAWDLVRLDTGESLGFCGDRFQPIQNREAFAFMDTVLASFGAKYETAGCLHGGRVVWMQAKLVGQSFNVNGVDWVDCFATFTNYHDGVSGAGKFFPTTERAVCANTHRVAMFDGDKGFSFSHNGSFKAKADRAAALVAKSIEAMAKYREAAEVMAKTRVDVDAYVTTVLDQVLEVTAADVENNGADLLAKVLRKSQANAEVAQKRIAAQIDRRKEIVADIKSRVEKETNTVGGMAGTLWQGFNAVTEHADHNTIGRQVGSAVARESRRFESVLNGDRDEIKQVAYATAVSAISA